MGVSETRVSLSAHAAAEAFKRDQMLLRALYKAQRILYQGKSGHIQVLRIGTSGGGLETEVYLMGNSKPIPPDEITIALEPVMP